MFFIRTSDNNYHWEEEVTSTPYHISDPINSHCGETEPILWRRQKGPTACSHSGISGKASCTNADRMIFNFQFLVNDDAQLMKVFLLLRSNEQCCFFNHTRVLMRMKRSHFLLTTIHHLIITTRWNSTPSLMSSMSSP